jgi:MMP 1-O-methyltransferase
MKTLISDIQASLAGVEGYLSTREVEGLALLASRPTCAGEILEIGTFKGKSTIVLSKAATLAGDPRVVAVDPLPVHQDEEGRRSYGQSSAFEECMANLERAGVRDSIEFHRLRSDELAASWPTTRRLRLLWIDGDHSYAGAKRDFDLFAPFMAPGGVIAMHDVLHEHGGPTRVFAEDVLLSKNFGEFGFFGSVGWSQYLGSPDACPTTIERKLKAYSQLSSMIRFTAFGGALSGLNKVRYKAARAQVPHGPLTPAMLNLCASSRSGLVVTP